MKYRIPIGTQIAPFSSDTGKIGTPVVTTISAEFRESEILKRMQMTNKGVETEYLCLPLGPNPSEFDSFLVRSAAAEPLED